MTKEMGDENKESIQGANGAPEIKINALPGRIDPTNEASLESAVRYHAIVDSDKNYNLGDPVEAAKQVEIVDFPKSGNEALDKVDEALTRVDAIKTAFGYKLSEAQKNDYYGVHQNLAAVSAIIADSGVDIVLDKLQHSVVVKAAELTAVVSLALSACGGTAQPTVTPEPGGTSSAVATETSSSSEHLNQANVTHAVETWNTFTVQGHKIDRTGKIVLAENDPGTSKASLAILDLNGEEFTLAGITLTADDGKDYPSLMLIDHDEKTGAVEADLLQPETTEGTQIIYDAAKLDATGGEAYLAGFKFIIDKPTDKAKFYIYDASGKKELLATPGWPSSADNIYNAVYKQNPPVALTQTVVPTVVPTEVPTAKPEAEKVSFEDWHDKIITGSIPESWGEYPLGDFWNINKVLDDPFIIENLPAETDLMILGTDGVATVGADPKVAAEAKRNGATITQSIKGGIFDGGPDNNSYEDSARILMQSCFREYQAGGNFCKVVFGNSPSDERAAIRLSYGLHIKVNPVLNIPTVVQDGVLISPIVYLPENLTVIKDGKNYLASDLGINDPEKWPQQMVDAGADDDSIMIPENHENAVWFVANSHPVKK